MWSARRWPCKARRKWGPHYLEGLSNADAVAIGGGNLLSDHDLNFPTKLALALRSAGASNLPLAIYACGMGGHWTKEGERRMRKALALSSPRAVFLRDEISKARWDARFADTAGQKAVVVRDPGLLAQDTYGPVERSTGDGPLIGLGVMSHVAVRYHAEARISETGLMRWYVDIARTLVRAGARVIVFTNGAGEDQAVQQALAPEFARLGPAVTQARPQTPRELAHVVGSCHALVAFRMHALIAGYSYAVPSIALKWDDKVDAFLASIDRSKWLLDPAEIRAEAAAWEALKAAEQGVDAAMHAAAIAEARADVAKLYAALAA